MYHIEKYNYRTNGWEHVQSFTSEAVALAVFNDQDRPSHRLVHTLAETYA